MTGGLVALRMLGAPPAARYIQLSVQGELEVTL